MKIKTGVHERNQKQEEEVEQQYWKPYPLTLRTGGVSIQELFLYQASNWFLDLCSKSMVAW
jgi:hypothetical protein